MEALSPETVQSFLERVQDARAEQPRPVRKSSFEELGRSWRALGVRPGELVILALPNGIDLLRHFFAVLSAGGVPTLVAPNTPSARLEALVDTLGVRAVAAIRLPNGMSGIESRQTLDELQVAMFPSQKQMATNPGEVVLLTSGTSGFASGCVFGLDALLLNAARHADAIGQRADDVVLVNLPLHFSFALVAQALATMLRGGRLVISGPPFHIPSYVKAVVEHSVTVSSLTPVLVRSLLEWQGTATLGLRVLTVGGDLLPACHAEQLLQRQPETELYLTYGLTQAGPRVSTLAAHREPKHRYASTGLPLAGTGVTLEELDDGSGMKQLVVSSQTVMRRRIGFAEGRAATDLRSPGVVATGDVFEQDNEGYLYFRGRLSDFIVRGGEKICLAAVRRVAVQLPHVVRAKTRVIDKPNGEADFELTLVTSAGASLDEAEYLVRLARQLRRSELPHRIEVLAEDPTQYASYK